MSDAFSKLKSKYELANRYANFGAVIRRMQVCGFRGISNLTIDFDFPITAISGLNGAGKSTIGQLATCGYRMPTGSVNYKRFYVAQLFPVSVADRILYRLMRMPALSIHLNPMLRQLPEMSRCRVWLQSGRATNGSRNDIASTSDSRSIFRRLSVAI
jgi:ABC-type enterochelin transport system ATPase subunit